MASVWQASIGLHTKERVLDDFIHSNHSSRILQSCLPSASLKKLNPRKKFTNGEKNLKSRFYGNNYLLVFPFNTKLNLCMADFKQRRYSNNQKLRLFSKIKMGYESDWPSSMSYEQVVQLQAQEEESRLFRNGPPPGDVAEVETYCRIYRLSEQLHKAVMDAVRAVNAEIENNLDRIVISETNSESLSEDQGDIPVSEELVIAGLAKIGSLLHDYRLTIFGKASGLSTPETAKMETNSFDEDLPPLAKMRIDLKEACLQLQSSLEVFLPSSGEPTVKVKRKMEKLKNVCLDAGFPRIDDDPSHADIPNFSSVKLRPFRTGRKFNYEEEVLFWRGGQVTQEGLAWLIKKGFKTIVDIRDYDVENQWIRPAIDDFSSKGMINYVRIPIAFGSVPTMAEVEKLAKLVADERNRPLYLHSQGGVGRACAFVSRWREFVVRGGLDQTSSCATELTKYGEKYLSVSKTNTVSQSKTVNDNVQRGNDFYASPSSPSPPSVIMEASPLLQKMDDNLNASDRSGEGKVENIFECGMDSVQSNTNGNGAGVSYDDDDVDNDDNAKKEYNESMHELFTIQPAVDIPLHSVKNKLSNGSMSTTTSNESCTVHSPAFSPSPSSSTSPFPSSPSPAFVITQQVSTSVNNTVTKVIESASDANSKNSEILLTESVSVKISEEAQMKSKVDEFESRRGESDSEIERISDTESDTETETDTETEAKISNLKTSFVVKNAFDAQRPNYNFFSKLRAKEFFSRKKSSSLTKNQERMENNASDASVRLSGLKKTEKVADVETGTITGVAGSWSLGEPGIPRAGKGQKSDESAYTAKDLLNYDDDDDDVSWYVDDDEDDNELYRQSLIVDQNFEAELSDGGKDGEKQQKGENGANKDQILHTASVKPAVVEKENEKEKMYENGSSNGSVLNFQTEIQRDKNVIKKPAAEDDSSSDEEGEGGRSMVDGDMCVSTTGVVRLQSRRKAEMYLVRTDGFSCTRERVKESTLAFTHPSTQQQMLMWKTPPKTVLLLKKLGDELMPEAQQVATWLHNHEGMNVVVEPDVHDKFARIPGFGFIQTFYNQDTGKLHERVDFIICLGGDGVILHASNLFSSAVPPVVSFNLGSLGFLTAHPFEDFKQDLKAIIHGNNSMDGVYITLRMRLRCEIFRNGKPIPGKVFDVMNEVVVDRGSTAYLCKIECYERNRLITKVQGDGVMVATPTGSTAYSTAAGGSMVHPNVPCMLFTPICPHSLSFRPVILPDSALLELKVPLDARNNTWVSFDGKKRQQLSRGDSIKIRMSEHPMPTVNKSDQTDDWFRSLVRCLNWNERLEQKAL